MIFVAGDLARLDALRILVSTTEELGSFDKLTSTCDLSRVGVAPSRLMQMAVPLAEEPVVRRL